ncbi:MAG: hypothetical protein QI223_08080 [Candidatus Korarchaeota archaeon]|nr:hypothetical protein [Candidatus Korarchaeota archaeon]
MTLIVYLTPRVPLWNGEPHYLDPFFSRESFWLGLSSRELLLAEKAGIDLLPRVVIFAFIWSDGTWKKAGEGSIELIAASPDIQGKLRAQNVEAYSMEDLKRLLLGGLETGSRPGSILDAKTLLQSGLWTHHIALLEGLILLGTPTEFHVERIYPGFSPKKIRIVRPPPPIEDPHEFSSRVYLDWGFLAEVKGAKP